MIVGTARQCTNDRNECHGAARFSGDRVFLILFPHLTSEAWTRCSIGRLGNGPFQEAVGINCKKNQ